MLNGESYDETIGYFGCPTVEKDIGYGKKYVAYLLRGLSNRYAYFILEDNKVVAEGVMFGDDYSILK